MRHTLILINSTTAVRSAASFGRGSGRRLCPVPPGQHAHQRTHVARDFYLLLSTAILYGLLAWLIYFTVARTQATATVLRQPLLVDAAEISAFLVIGEQGLILALLFIGGMTLSLLLLLYSALDPSAFLQIDFWLILSPLALTPVAIFFLAMLPTHRVL